MRIYGGKDYYDSVVAWGQDPKTVLVRSTTFSFPAKQVPLDVPTLQIKLNNRVDYLTAHWIVVVFCDKVYRGLKVYRHGTDHFFWNVGKFKEWTEEHRITISEHMPWFGSRHKKLTLANSMDVLPVSDALREFMLTHRLAILCDLSPEMGEDRPIQANPPYLKQYGFAKAVDPYTAFQELSMWISGILGGQSPETVHITDDKVLLENHGFDKHSFRSSARI